VERVKKMRLNHGMLDIAFAGNPNQSDPETCKGLEELFDWRRTMSCDEAGKYKYALDVYGNGWSSQFKRLMTANAPTFKSTIYPECLAPWVHYVLIQNAYSDLYDVLVFFRGDLAVRWAHEELVAKIAREGVECSLTFWREEDAVAFFVWVCSRFISWLWWDVVGFHVHINTFFWSNADFVFHVGASST
ncbi:hypothetical protein K503DRAFT_699927, partial [Rhizopogon vinicolor AM-OR11-026]